MLLKELKLLSSNETSFFILPSENYHYVLENLKVYQDTNYDDYKIKKIISLENNAIGIILENYETTNTIDLVKNDNDMIPVGRTKDLTGQKFGKLTVLYRVKSPKNNDKPYWKCLCDCGNTIIQRASTLKEGTGRKSCGCEKSLINKRFGKLLCLEELKEKHNNRYYYKYKCICDCGNITYVHRSHLIQHNTMSCGKCSNKMSRGEYLIQDILKNNNIIYEIEKTFQTCRFIDTNHLARFDFYVNNHYLIEMDGEQHYSAIDIFGGELKFKYVKEHDSYKNQWCKENNIPLIRIPYTKINTLCIEDLMLETTEFRVV